jgi:PAS domain S-box-containing protein
VRHRIVRPDGAVRWLASRGRLVDDAAGQGRRLAGVSADVTEQVRFEHVRARQDQVLGAVDVGVWYCDLPFDVLLWDRTVKEHFWLPADAHVTLDTFYARLHADDRAPTRAAIERSIADGAPYDVEFRTVAPAEHAEAGAVRWVRAIGYTAHDAAGRPTRFDGVTVDVTASKRAADRLAASEQRYEYAARAASNAIWDWDLASDHIAWNPGVSEVFGWAPADVAPTAAWWYAHIHPDDRDRVVGGVQRVIDGAEGGHSWRDEYRFLRADGAYARVVDRGYVARDGAGRAVRMIGAMEDVTGRRVAEAALRASEERFRAVVDATDQYIWTNDAAGRMDAEQPGWVAPHRQGPAEYAGHGWAAAVHPDDRARAPSPRGRRRWPPATASRWSTGCGGTTASGGTSGCARCPSPAWAGRCASGWGSTPTSPTASGWRRRCAGREEEFRTLANAIPQLVWTTRPDGYHDFFNDRWYDFTGMPRGYENGWDWKNFLHPDDYERAVTMWTHSLRTGEPYSIEYRFRDAATGEYRWFIGRALPQRGDRGRDRAVVRHVHRHRGAEARRGGARPGRSPRRGTSASGCRRCSPRSPSAIAVSEGARAPHRGGERGLHGPRRRAPARRPHGARGLSRAGGQGFFELLDRVYATGEPYEGSEVPAPVDRDGDGVAEEYVFNFTYQPLRDVDGRVTGVLTHAIDITEQVRSRQRVERLAAELERERSRLAELLEQAPAAISVSEGREHVTVSQNAMSRRMLGGRSVLGRRVLDVVPDAAAQGYLALLDRVYDTGEPFVGSEMPVRFDFAGDGTTEERYFNIVYQAVRADDGRVRGILTHAVDVTAQVLARREVERKAAELAELSDALERSNRELDQFAYVASHDLKAPLRGIANLTQWIEEDLGDKVTGESRDHMRLLKGRVHRMEGLIDGILSYSRAGRVRVTPERVELAALARDAVELVAPPPGARVEVADDLPAVVAERVPLQQVLLNLIGNAVKFAMAHRPDARVRVAWRDAGEFVELRVSDNGPGIAPEFQERIWGSSRRCRRATRSRGRGSGCRW